MRNARKRPFWGERNLNTLVSEFVFGNKNFGLDLQGYHPALYVGGFAIYLYAICIVTGMCLAILVGGLYLKKRGYDPYDITIYALAIIPLGVLGARAYVYVFPWDGGSFDWSTFFNFRSGGLGIYGGVIVGYVSAFVCSKVQKQRFSIIVDCIMPGVLLAQSLGRWGNYFNQEAYGNLIATAYDALPHASSGLFANFNGYAVYIDSLHAGSGAGWYQATFFYESVCTFVGFLICIFVLMPNKRYKLGWTTAFYGIYYGVARLVIEGMRSDSLYLFVGSTQTDIKISQLVSICTIALGLWTLSKVYRKQLHALYKKFFADDYQEMRTSRWILSCLALLLICIATLLFALGGEYRTIFGVACVLLAVYSILGVLSLQDRLKVYCNRCHKQTLDVAFWQTDYEKYRTATICFAVVIALLVAVAIFSLVAWGILQSIANGVVL